MVPKLFISYVRCDTEADVTALSQSLRNAFGEEAICKDTDEIPLGANWKDAVRAVIDASVAVLWVIGPSWEPSDAVVMELRHALDRNVPVIPVLMRGADMDAATGNLAEELSALSDLNAATMRHASWDRDLTPLLRRLRELGLAASSPVNVATSSNQSAPQTESGMAPQARVLETGWGRVVFELVLTSESFVIDAKTFAKARVDVDGRKVKVRTNPRWIKFDVPSQHGGLATRLRLGGWGSNPSIAALQVAGRSALIVRDGDAP